MDLKLYELAYALILEGKRNSVEISKIMNISSPESSMGLVKIVNELFLGLTRARFSCVHVEESTSVMRLYPVMEIPDFKEFMFRPINDRLGPKPKVSERVRLSLWHGDNAPEFLDNWTGTIIERSIEKTLIEYVINRDADQQLVKTGREFIFSRLLE